MGLSGESNKTKAEDDAEGVEEGHGSPSLKLPGG